MVKHSHKHIQTTRWLLPTNCLSVFDHFVGLALKGLIKLDIWGNILLHGFTKIFDIRAVPSLPKSTLITHQPIAV